MIDFTYGDTSENSLEYNAQHLFLVYEYRHFSHKQKPLNSVKDHFGAIVH